MPSEATRAKELAGLIERVEKATYELDVEDALRILTLGQGTFVCAYLPHRGDDGSDEYSMLIDRPNGRVVAHVSERDLPDRSVDAALALVERMLPGALVSVGRGPNHTKRKRKSDGARIPWDGYIATNDLIGEDSHHFSITEGTTAPLAILLALLRALQEPHDAE